MFDDQATWIEIAVTMEQLVVVFETVWRSGGDGFTNRQNQVSGDQKIVAQEPVELFSLDRANAWK
jgi:hypothetical protein